MGRIVLGRRLPLQPSLGQLEDALTQEDRVAKIVQGAMRRPIVSTASPEAYEELGSLVRRLDAAWDTLANDRLRRSQLSGVTAFLRKMGEGSTAWKQAYGDFASRQADGDLLEQVARGPGRKDRLKVGEHLELVVELHHDDRGDVTSVDVVESSGDVSFDEDVRRSFLDITSTHRPRGNNVRMSRIRLVADSRVSVPKCGAYQDRPGPGGPSGRTGQNAVIACGFDFSEKSVEVPFSTQVSGATQLEAAEMR